MKLYNTLSKQKGRIRAFGGRKGKDVRMRAYRI